MYDPLIKMVLFTFSPKTKETKSKVKDEDFNLMIVLLASKNPNIIWKYDKSLKNILPFS